MQRTGIATFSLDYGKCPPWLFERMVKLSREIIRVLVEEYGEEEFIKRIADPAWFQSLGTVLAFDWNSSGLTTILTAALKEAIRGDEKNLGIFICGGKGKTSRKTPTEINEWGEKLNLPQENVHQLQYCSRMVAKVDTSLLQDGYQIYHHTFFFTRKKSWAVIQQGMNTQNQTARRYHWSSYNVKEINNLTEEPHTGIISSGSSKKRVLNLTSKESRQNKEVSLELIKGSYLNLVKEIKLLDKYFSKLTKTATFQVSLFSNSEKEKEENHILRLLKLENIEFKNHPIKLENFFTNKYLEKILYKIFENKPKTYQEILALNGVGPKTIRALSLVSEIIYGAKPSYQDPARYSFAHGGKDGTPYFVDTKTYDKTIEIMKIVSKSKLPFYEKNKIFSYFKNKKS